MNTEDQPDPSDSLAMQTMDTSMVGGSAQHRTEPASPDETVVAETSRITHSTTNYLNDPNAFAPAPTSKKADHSGRDDGHKNQDRDQTKGGQHKKDEHEQDQQKKNDQSPQPDRAGRAGVMSYVLMGVVALVCGVGGAAAFSYFDSSKNDDQEQQKKDESKKKGGDSKKKDSSKSSDESKQSEGGGQNDTGSEIPGFTSAEDANTLKEQIKHLSARFDTLQQRVDSMSVPQNQTPPDLGTLQIKVGQLARSVDEVNSLPARTRTIETRLDEMSEDLKSIRNRLPENRDRDGATQPKGIGAVDRRVDALTGPPPVAPPPASLTDNNSPDFAMAEGIAQSKRGRYPLADDIFRKLRLTKADDARIWYYSALAHGFTSGQWEGETRDLVMQGGERERAGKPTTSQIDAAFADLSTAQGKDWLAAYRAQMTKR